MWDFQKKLFSIDREQQNRSAILLVSGMEQQYIWGSHHVNINHLSNAILLTPRHAKGINTPWIVFSLDCNTGHIAWEETLNIKMIQKYIATPQNTFGMLAEENFHGRTIIIEIMKPNSQQFSAAMWFWAKSAHIFPVRLSKWAYYITFEFNGIFVQNTQIVKSEHTHLSQIINRGIQPSPA